MYVIKNTLKEEKKMDKRTKRLESIIRYARRCNSLEAARSIAKRFIKPAVVVKRNDGYFWIVTMGEGGALERAGYEIIW